jgi:hypothetical protein
MPVAFWPLQEQSSDWLTISITLADVRKIISNWRIWFYLGKKRRSPLSPGVPIRIWVVWEEV